MYIDGWDIFWTILFSYIYFQSKFDRIQDILRDMENNK